MTRTKNRFAAILLILSLFATMIPSGFMEGVATRVSAATYPSNPRINAEGITTWDCITFGNYYQSDATGTTKEPIKWRVLSVNGNDAFLLADQSLDCQPYNEEYIAVTWATCTLRTWLNSTFLNTAFSTAEQEAIYTTTVVNDDNPYFNAEGGEDTADRIFLLSISEVCDARYGFDGEYEKNSATREAKNTAYMGGRGAWRSTVKEYEGNGWWWLRSPGHYSNNAASVDGGGYGHNDGSGVHDASDAVRPALHLNLQSSNLWQNAGVVTSAGGGGSTNPTNTPNPTNPTETEDTEKVSDIKIGNEVEFTIGDDVPFIGGGKISMDMSMIPVQFEREGNVFRMGIGCSNLLDSEWTGFKKFVESQRDDLRKGCNSMLASKFGIASMGMKVKPEISCYGYAEGTIENGKIKSIAGKTVLEIKVKATQEWQIMVVVVPVVIKLKAEVGVKTSYAIGLDFSQKKVYMKGDMEITLPKITLSAGVGVAYIADVSVYGSAENKIKIKEDGTISAALAGEAGVSAKVLFASYKKAIIKGTWEYYDSGKMVASTALSRQMIVAEEMLGEENYTIQRVRSTNHLYPAQSDLMNGQNVQDTGMKEANAVTTLTTDGYGDMAPKLVSVSENKFLLVYTADCENRSTGNHTAVCYRLYDSSSGEWTEEKLVDNDADNPTADFYPSVASDGTNIYIAWSDTGHADFTENTPLSDVSKACEIKTARFNPNTSSFEVPETLTENTMADLKPVVTLSEGVPYVSWVEYEGNDILSLNGTNRICQAVLTDGHWIVNELVELDKPITAMQSGLYGGSVGVVYTADEDENIQTPEDRELYLLTPDGTEPVQLTENETAEENPQFVVIDGSQQLIWHVQQEGLYNKTPDEDATCIIPADGTLNANYQIVQGAQEDMLICSSAQEDSSQLYCYFFRDGSVTQPIALTDMEGYLSSMYGCELENGSYGIAFTRTKPTIETDSITEENDLCFRKLSPYTNLTLQDITYAEEDVQPGETLSLTASVTNQGIHTVSTTSVTAVAFRNVLAEKSNVSIAPGETKDVVLEVSLPEDMTASTAIDVSVSAGIDELDETDNSKVLSIGKPDLEIEVEETHTTGKSRIKATVKNSSGFATEGKLNIRKQDERGVVLASYSLGELAPGATISKELTEEAVAAIAQNGDSLYLEVEAASEETFYSNNFAFAAVTEPEDPTDVTNPTNPTNPPNPTNPTDVTNPTVSEKPTTKVSVSKITLGRRKLTLGVKESVKLTATISPKNATARTITWLTSNNKVAAVSKGKIVAKKVGKAKITARTANGKKAVCIVTVKNAPKKISLSTKTKTLKKGKSFTLKVKLPKNTASFKYTFKSSKPSVAKVSSSGKVTAKKKGTTKITVSTFNGKKAICKVKVK